MISRGFASGILQLIQVCCSTLIILICSRSRYNFVSLHCRSYSYLFAGMNFCDFFAFMARFAFANLYQLYHLREGLSRRAQHMIFNLKAIQRIALKMNSISQCGYEDILSSFKEILEDSSFLELCVTLEETYTKTYDEHGIMSYSTEPSSMHKNFFDFSDSRNCSPEDLALIIDHALANVAIASDKC